MATLELTNDLLVEIGGWPALKEARALVGRGRVRDVRRDGAVIRACVQDGERIYDAQITLADRPANIEVRCTCAESRRSGRVCAHALAAGLALMQAVASPVAAAGPRGGAVAGEGTAARRAAATGEAPTKAATERPRIIFRTGADGALELISEDGRREARVVPRAEIADFLSREFSSLERSCELAFAPGFEEFRLEIGRPEFEARLEGALPGLTLELIACYGDKEFLLNGKTESSAYQRYFPATEPSNFSSPNPVHPINPVKKFSSVFWRRNVLAEREALAQVEAAGFSLVRSGAATLSLISENRVAPFLANTLPRWRRAWRVRFGPRLEAAMAEIDVAQPEFSLRAAPAPAPGLGSGEDWLALDLKLSVRGKPIPLDAAEIQRWLQTGQSHARTSDKRVLLVPTEAWSEMKEVLADCDVDQEPGKIRVARKFAPYLAGALTAQGFRAGENVATDPPPPDVKGALDEKLWGQLRPYQAQGVEWLAGLAQRNLHGLLADDMGLGKTLQALAFCAWVRGGRFRTEGEGRGGKEEEEGEVSEGERQGKFLTELTELRNYGIFAAGGGEEGGTAAQRAAATRGAMLVVCPTSLVTNWLREAARFTPWLRTLDLTGADRAEKFGKRNEYDLLVTSYAILRRDAERYLADEFSLVILDEAQHIKNRGSQNAQSAKALRARHRLILTGTPLENSVLDLWSLYDFLLPGYLGTAADFRERYESPPVKGIASKPDARVMERLRHRVRPFFLRRTKEEVLTELPPKLEFLTLCELSDEQREVYRAVLAQGRREVFEHSGKAGRNSGRDRMAVLTTLLRLRQVCCHLDLLPGGGRQGEFLTELTELRNDGIFSAGGGGEKETEVSHGGGGREEGRGGEGGEVSEGERQGKFLTELTELRNFSEGGGRGGEEGKVSHGGGGRGGGRGEGRGKDGGGTEIDWRETEFRGSKGRSQMEFGNEGLKAGEGFARRTEEGEGRGGEEGGNGEAGRWKEPSAKMERAFELIDEAMDGGHRVLLFSQFVRVLHLLRDEARRRELRFCYLDGQTVERQAEVDRFQEDAEIPLFLISLKAGGTGLNLTGADTVIHFDPWWNPAVEEQATARAHRMGQARRVQAYKLIAAGTVEEKIQALQARKRELFEASMGGDEAFVEKLTGEDLEELLTE